KDIGKNAPASINGTPVDDLKQAAVRPPEGIGAKLLAVLEARGHFPVISVTSFRVRFLNAPARRCKIPGDREPDSRAVTQFELFLDQTLAKGPSSDHQPAVPVLHCTGQHFTGR